MMFIKNFPFYSILLSIVLFLAGAAHADSTINGEFTPTPAKHKFAYLGNDNGWQERLEAIPGRQWLNFQGQPEDAIRLMSSCGLNAVRVTVSNGQPLVTNIPIQYDSNGFPVSQIGAENGYGLNYGGVDGQVNIARRAKSYGMNVILTIDLGSDIPTTWVGHTYRQMLSDIDAETRRLLDPFLQAGIQPDIIIASNETNGGTLHINTSISDADNQNPASPSYRLKDRYTDGQRDSNGNLISNWTAGVGTAHDLVFSDVATGTNTIWPKCAGFHKQQILSARAEIAAMGYDVTRTRFGLHSQGTSADGYFNRIFAPPASEPNYETDYYDGNGHDLGRVGVLDQPNPQGVTLASVKLRDLVDVLGVSFYPGHPVAGTQAAFDADLNQADYNGLQSNSTAQPLRDILNAFSTYGFNTGLDPATGKYTVGLYKGEPAKVAIILETRGEEYTNSYKAGLPRTDANRVNDGNSPTREANFMTYFLNTLAKYPFMAGAMWWEGEYAQFEAGSDLYVPGPFYGSYTYTDATGKQVTNPNYNDSPVYQALPILKTWGQFGAPSPTAAFTLTNAAFGTALETGLSSGSLSTMQPVQPTLRQTFHVAFDAKMHFNFLNWGTSQFLSTLNKSKVPGDPVVQTAVHNPPTAGQDWDLLPNGLGTQQIVNNGSGLALDAPDGHSPVQTTKSKAKSQQWMLALLPRVNLVNVASGGVLDSGPGSIYGGQWTAIQQLNSISPVPSQQWQVVGDGNGYVRIVCSPIFSNNGDAPLVLGTWNNSTTVGDHVEQTPLANPIQPGQEWKLVSVAGSAYQIVNRRSGLALDALNGPGIQNSVAPNSLSQQWKLVPVY